MIRRHRIRVVRGTPDHIELAALTAALVILARTAHVPRAPHSARHRRAHWDRNVPSVVHHPAQSWRARPASPLV
ncbi:acyl-CoA carboxylase epsilon subunit [Streptomyces katrae]|uniref:acyl-CoA carboxylase epsilon subunit n=1 Tax=Streptomyces katrae TaxID=68223 RepID=UPI00131DEF44|nr:acyl-CoA carboxylase epsilon subunit [Streptomyces katrae]